MNNYVTYDELNKFLNRVKSLTFYGNSQTTSSNSGLGTVKVISETRLSGKPRKFSVSNTDWVFPGKYSYSSLKRAYLDGYNAMRKTMQDSAEESSYSR